jgi:hypothetical protein
MMIVTLHSDLSCVHHDDPPATTTFSKRSDLIGIDLSDPIYIQGEFPQVFTRPHAP